MTLDGGTSFSRIKNLRNTCKCSYYSQRSWRDFYSCNGGKLATSEGYTCLFGVFFCVLESKKSIITSGLLPSISLVVGQSSVNISLALVKYPLHD